LKNQYFSPFFGRQVFAGLTQEHFLCEKFAQYRIDQRVVQVADTQDFRLASRHAAKAQHFHP